MSVVSEWFDGPDEIEELIREEERAVAWNRRHGPKWCTRCEQYGDREPSYREGLCQECWDDVVVRW